MTPKINIINSKKNLLAFSAGVDSSALFFILLENSIPFDIIIVNYNTREQSKDEVDYAKSLAKKYNKQIFVKEVFLEITSNFEKNARDIRYDFFDEIILQNDYETLITAHQLNDKLEWFLMQFSKGAGLYELLSFEEQSIRKDYKVLKPLINTSRDEIIEYLEKNNIKYFIDHTNEDEKYKRNYFRKNFSNKFISKFKEGIKNSFKYLENDKKSLIKDDKTLVLKDLEIFKSTNDENLDIRKIDKSLKQRGFLLSKLSRDEILKQKECVISHKIAISILDNYIFIAPYEKEAMTKEFKEKCRVNRIPKNIRFYIFKENLLDEILLFYAP